MNLKVEEILMVVIAFLIGYFLSNMISGSSSGSGSRVKAVGGKHTTAERRCKQMGRAWSVSAGCQKGGASHPGFSGG